MQANGWFNVRADRLLKLAVSGAVILIGKLPTKTSALSLKGMQRMKSEGVIRGTAYYYRNSLESLEIHIDKNTTDLPYVEGKRLSIRLIVGAKPYLAGLRATKNNSYIWICPNLRDGTGEKLSLAQVLGETNFVKNERVNLFWLEQPDMLKISVVAVQEAT